MATKNETPAEADKEEAEGAEAKDAAPKRRFSLKLILMAVGGVEEAAPFRDALEDGAASEAANVIQRLMRDEVLEAVEKLRPIAADLKLSLSQLSLAWVLRQPNLSSAIIGASRPEQIDDNVGASGVKLDAATLQAIDDAVGAVAQR